jgi:hypothetical protein
MRRTSEVFRACDWVRGIRAALFVPAAVVVICPAVVHAGPCGENIARLEAAQRDSRIVPNMRQSVAAQLHHQPTPGTVANAESKAKKELDEALVVARKLDSEGKESECMATLQKLGVPLSVR